MRDLRPDLSPLVQGVIAAVVLVVGLRYTQGKFYWWSVPIALGFGSLVVLQVRRQLARGRATLISDWL